MGWARGRLHTTARSVCVMAPANVKRQPLFCLCCRGGAAKRDRKWAPLYPGQWAVVAYAALAVLFLAGLAATGNLSYAYFTYWGWTWQAAWSVAWTVFILSDAHGRTEGAEGAWLFTTAGFSLAYLTVVGVIITVVPAEEGTAWVLTMSEDMSLGLVNLGNLVAHYVPWAAASMLVIARRDAISAFCGELDSVLKPVGMVWVRSAWLWTSSVSGLVALSNVWSAWFDFNTVYLTSVEEWLAFLMGIGGIVVVAALLQVTAYRPDAPQKRPL